MKDVKLTDNTPEHILQVDSKSKIKKLKLNKKNVFILLGFILCVALLFFIQQRVTLVKVNDRIHFLISNFPISEEDKKIISIKPGYYYSKKLKINIYIPEGISGEEHLDTIFLKKNKERGEIVIRRYPNKYDSLQEGIERTSSDLINKAKKSGFETVQGFEGMSYMIDDSSYFKQNYFFYINGDFYVFSTNDRYLYIDLHDLAFRFEYSDSPITPPTRKTYNFEKIMKENFRNYENNKSGFSISYPTEAEIAYLNYDQISSRYGRSTADQAESSMIFSFISQPPGAYEMYDGLSVEVIVFPNINRKTLDQLASERIDYDPQYQTGTKLEKYMTVNNIKIAKLVSCCYAGGTTKYIFLTKEDKYFIEIVVFSPGRDKENFDQVADKMINSLKLVN